MFLTFLHCNCVYCDQNTFYLSISGLDELQRTKDRAQCKDKDTLDAIFEHNKAFQSLVTNQSSIVIDYDNNIQHLSLMYVSRDFHIVIMLNMAIFDL